MEISYVLPVSSCNSTSCFLDDSLFSMMTPPSNVRAVMDGSMGEFPYRTQMDLDQRKESQDKTKEIFKFVLQNKGVSTPDPNVVRSAAVTYFGDISPGTPVEPGIRPGWYSVNAEFRREKFAHHGPADPVISHTPGVAVLPACPAYARDEKYYESHHNEGWTGELSHANVVVSLSSTSGGDEIVALSEPFNVMAREVASVIPHCRIGVAEGKMHRDFGFRACPRGRTVGRGYSPPLGFLAGCAAAGRLNVVTSMPYRALVSQVRGFPIITRALLVEPTQDECEHHRPMMDCWCSEFERSERVTPIGTGLSFSGGQILAYYAWMSNIVRLKWSDSSRVLMFVSSTRVILNNNREHLVKMKQLCLRPVLVHPPLMLKLKEEKKSVVDPGQTLT